MKLLIFRIREPVSPALLAKPDFNVETFGAHSP
jgi:hypothetical protein